MPTVLQDQLVPLELIKFHLKALALLPAPEPFGIGSKVPLGRQERTRIVNTSLVSKRGASILKKKVLLSYCACILKAQGRWVFFWWEITFVISRNNLRC